MLFRDFIQANHGEAALTRVSQRCEVIAPGSNPAELSGAPQLPNCERCIAVDPSRRQLERRQFRPVGRAVFDHDARRFSEHAALRQLLQERDGARQIGVGWIGEDEIHSSRDSVQSA